MKIEQLYTGCLAEAAYYIESDPYVKMASDQGAKIKYIFETHFHADFVSGHVDLAKKTDATIVYGPEAKTNYDVHVAEDGEEFKIGKLTLKVLHTPGHTLESSTYLLTDEDGKNRGIFTGDTLFIGDVGRPDLAIKSDVTKEDLAGMLFDSLRNKIMPLEDDITVYPAHGAGSSCGKNMSSETTDTLGNQKKTNYALREGMTKEEFVKEVTEGILPPPQYFAKNAMLNKMGYEEVDEVISRGNNALSVEEVEKAVADGALVLDVRDPQEFAQGFIPNSTFIGLEGMFAIWVGTIIKDLQQPIVLVAPEGREEEAVLRLARVGYDKTAGYIDGGFDAWAKAGKPVDVIHSIPATEFAERMKEESLMVLDVRKNSEHLSEHVIGAQNFPVDFINEKLKELDSQPTYYVHCAGGYRSMIAASIMKRNGYDLVDIAGGFKAIAETDAPKSEYVCPSTL